MPIAISSHKPESFPEIDNHILEEGVFFLDEDLDIELETPATPYNSPMSPRNNETDNTEATIIDDTQLLSNQCIGADSLPPSFSSTLVGTVTILSSQST